MASDFTERTLGRSGFHVGRLGLASSYGATARGFEEAFERGCNYFYWGSFRRPGMGEAIRALSARHREKLVVVLQSYARLPGVSAFTLKRGLKKLKLDYADVLLLGWYNKMPSQRMLDGVAMLKEQGLIKKVAISCHNRPTFQTYIKDPRFDIIMTRYNAAHRGAEREVFPFLDTDGVRPGVVSYTATRWGYLVNPKYTPQGCRTPTAADCYRFVLTNSNVDICLTGPSSDEELRANLKALEQGPMNAEEMSWMRSVGDHVHRLTSKKFSNPFMQRQQ